MLRRPIAAIAASLALAATGDAQVVNPPVAFGGGNAAPALPASPTPLPALPLPVGARLMGFGDSLIAFNHDVQTTTVAGTTSGAAYNRASGVLATAWMDDPRFNFDTWYDPAQPYPARPAFNGANQGIGGDHLDDSRAAFGNGCLPRTRYATARAPDIVYLLCGTNTIYSGDDTAGVPITDPAYLTAKLDAIIRQFTSRGTWVVISTLYPRGDWKADYRDRCRATLDAVNVWIRAQAGRAGVKVVDPFPALGTAADPDQPNPALFQADLVHPNAEGARVIAQQFVQPVLAGMIAPGSIFDQDPATGNLYAADVAQMAGTAGTKGTATTGTVATGYSVARSRGTTTSIVASIEDAGAYKRQVLAINGVGDPISRYSYVTFNPPALDPAPAIAAGSWMRYYLHVETGAAVPSASLIRMLVRFQNGSTTLQEVYASWEPSSDAFDIRATGRGGYWMATPPVQVPAGVNHVAPIVQVYVRNSIEAPFTVKFDRPILRVVPDPRPAWGL